MGIQVSTIDLYFETVTCSILIMIYLVIIIRALKGSGFTFVIKLCSLLILFNFGVLSHKWFLVVLNNGTVENMTPLLVLEAISIVIQYASFNVSHWIFAF